MAHTLIENKAPVMTIIINRPEVKNAIDVIDSLNAPEFFAGIDRYAKGRGRHGEFDE
jgi:hypothetical protein